MAKKKNRAFPAEATPIDAMRNVGKAFVPDIAKRRAIDLRFGDVIVEEFNGKWKKFVVKDNNLKRSRTGVGILVSREDGSSANWWYDNEFEVDILVK